MNTIDKIQSIDLKQKYQKKLQKYIDFAMKNVFESDEKIEFEFYQYGLCRVSIITKNMEIEDNKKACVKDGKIYISDWAMEQNKDVLMHIVIHEIFHVLYPEYSENKVKEETDNKFKKLKKSALWKTFLP